MVRSPVRRAAKYNVKIDPESISKRFEGMKTIMQEQVNEVYAELAGIEEKVKAILDKNNVPVIKIPFYLSFARELYRVVKSHPGATAVSEAALLASKWAGRGLTAAVLQSIAKDVFGITITVS